MMELNNGNYDVAILGGGAAGLMCAIEAGKRGKRVVVLERSEKIGKKILISGGGRCNFTHLDAQPANYLSANPHFCRSALARYQPRDFLTLIERHHIPFVEKTPGQLFCRDTARSVTEMLQTEASEAGVTIELRCDVQEVLYTTDFCIKTRNQSYRAPTLVIATGGLSIPKMGATDFGYRIATQFGHTIAPCYPALVPLLWEDRLRERFGTLSGVSFLGTIACGEVSFRDKILFTHRGLSGPAVLQISSYWGNGRLQDSENTLVIDFSEDSTLEEQLLNAKRSGSTQETKNFLAQQISQPLPKRFTDIWFSHFAHSQPLAGCTDRQLRDVATGLQHFAFNPNGSEGYEKAEVTAGGVSTTELSSKTFESSHQKGLFFIGEVVDVTGQLGGYNFQWAWASGHAAGQHV